MKILDVKLHSLTVHVHTLSTVGERDTGIYGLADGIATIFSDSQSSADIRVQLTPAEQAEIRGLFERISKRLKEES